MTQRGPIVWTTCGLILGAFAVVHGISWWNENLKPEGIKRSITETFIAGRVMDATGGISGTHSIPVLTTTRKGDSIYIEGVARIGRSLSHIPSLTPEGYTGYSGLPADGTLDVPFSGSAKIVSAPAFKLFGYSFNRPKLDRLSCAVKPPAIDPLEKAWQAPTKEAGNALFDALIFTNREDTLEGLKRDEVLGIISMRVYLEDNDWHFLERVMPYTIEKKRPDSLWRKRRWDLTRQAVDQLDYKAIFRIEHPNRIRNIFENGGMRLPTAPLY